MKSDIKILILAAGSGSRLKMNLPKAMVLIKGQMTIIQHQLENLSPYFDRDNIHVVVGYKKELIMGRFPYLNFMCNKNYAITNTARSLQLGLYNLKGHDVLWLNGDVVFDPSILKWILNNKQHNLICVNNSSVSAEEVKYTIDQKGFISEISKQVENGLGEAVGINFIKRKNIKDFLIKLDQCDDMDYFEKGVEMSIKDRSMSFIPLNIQDKFCLEIDFIQDLELAKEYFEKLNK